MRRDQLCLRCRQTGHQCEGYLEQTFVNENTRFGPSFSVNLPTKRCSNHDMLYKNQILSPMLGDICISHLRNDLFVTNPLDNLSLWLGFRALEGTLGLCRRSFSF